MAFNTAYEWGTVEMMISIKNHEWVDTVGWFGLALASIISM